MAIERGRQNLIEQQQMADASREMFTTGIALLREFGSATRAYLVFPVTSVSHTVNSPEGPSVRVDIQSGRNLERAKTVWICVEGVEKVLKVSRKGHGDQEAYKPQLLQNGFSMTCLREVREFQTSVKDVSRGLRLERQVEGIINA